MSITYDTTHRNTVIGRDITVMQLSAAPGNGTSGAPTDCIGIFETMDIALKREFADTTGSADIATTSRAMRWGKGSVKLTGFNRGAASKLASVFANSSHAILSFSESATGDEYQLMCTCDDFDKSVGKETTKDSISLGVEGVPFYGQNGSTPTAMVLED